MKHLAALFLAGSFVFGSASCAPKVERPTQAQLDIAQQRWPEATLPNLEEGRRLYLKRCGDCHDLPLPAARTSEQWPAIIKDMGEYSQFDEQQTNLVLQFVISARETPKPTEATGAEN